MLTINTDVLIIGGGISGCAAALEFKNNLDVTVIEKNTSQINFGECLGKNGFECLKWFGALNCIEHEFKGVTFVTPNFKKIYATEKTWLFNRKKLQNFLWKKLRKMNCRLIKKCEYKSMRYKNDEIEITCKKNNKKLKFLPKLILFAMGDTKKFNENYYGTYVNSIESAVFPKNIFNLDNLLNINFDSFDVCLNKNEFKNGFCGFAPGKNRIYCGVFANGTPKQLHNSMMKFLNQHKVLKGNYQNYFSYRAMNKIYHPFRDTRKLKKLHEKYRGCLFIGNLGGFQTPFGSTIVTATISGRVAAKSILKLLEKGHSFNEIKKDYTLFEEYFNNLKKMKLINDNGSSPYRNRDIYELSNLELNNLGTLFNDINITDIPNLITKLSVRLINPKNIIILSKLLSKIDSILNSLRGIFYIEKHIW